MNFEGTAIENATVQIRRKNESAWLTLGSPANLNPWTAKIAGTFEMRGIGSVDGKSVETPIAEVEVRFPEYSEITGDSSVLAAMNSAWTQTTNACTAMPNERREYGFWILLNTQTNIYITDPLLIGPLVTPTVAGSLNPNPQPSDIPQSPSPTDNGATYVVGLFHTHTPRTYLTPSNSYRVVGPSRKDVSYHNAHGIVGVVYDYIGTPYAGSATNRLYNGHPIDDPIQLYPIQPNRRPTPCQ